MAALNTNGGGEGTGGGGDGGGGAATDAAGGGDGSGGGGEGGGSDTDTPTGGGDGTGGGGDGGGGLDATPVSTSGAITLPTLPFTSNVSVSAIDAELLPSSNEKLIVSPPASAYTVIWYIGRPTYAPNGGTDGVACRPRTSVPANASSVPDDWSRPPTLTSAVTVMLLS